MGAGLELHMPRPIEIAPLFAQYERFLVNSTERYVRIDVSDVPNAEHVQIDAIVKIGSNWERRKIDGPVLEFCREDDGDDIEQLYLVFSNHDRDRNGKIDSTYHITLKTFCPGGWSGQIAPCRRSTSTRRSPSRSLHRDRTSRAREADVDGDRHRPGDIPVLPFPVEQINDGVAGRALRRQRYDVQRPELRHLDFHRVRQREWHGANRFQHVSRGSGSFSFTPAEIGHTFDAPITDTNRKCVGGSSSVDGRQDVSRGSRVSDHRPGVTRTDAAAERSRPLRRQRDGVLTTSSRQATWDCRSRT